MAGTWGISGDCADIHLRGVMINASPVQIRRLCTLLIARKLRSRLGRLHNAELSKSAAVPRKGLHVRKMQLGTRSTDTSACAKRE